MDNSKEIKKLRDKADVLEAQQIKFESQDPTIKLAELIHAKMCRWNHTDGCGWHYETWDNVGYARSEYLKKAIRILDEVNFDIAAYVINKI